MLVAADKTILRLYEPRVRALGETRGPGSFRPGPNRTGPMNRHDRRAARAYARHQPLTTVTADQVADRQHLLLANRKEIQQASASSSSGDVIVVCDTRDPVARDWAKASGMSEGTILRLEAQIMGRCIPTVLLAMPIDAAATLAASTTPGISEELERRADEGGGRLVLVIAAGGTAMAALPKPWSHLRKILTTDARLPVSIR